MNNSKMLGLAVLAALAATALVGAGSASATVLCDTTPGAGNACPQGHAYPADSTLEAHAEDVSLGPIGYGGDELICDMSDMTVTTTTAGGAGAAVDGLVDALDFQGCSGASGGVPCEVGVTGLPYSASIEYIFNPDGILTFAEGTFGEPGFVMVCAGAIECAYTFGETDLDVVGGAPASVIAQEDSLHLDWGLCRSWSLWSASYEVTAPTAIYVADS